VNLSGGPSSGFVWTCSISDDGRFVAFDSTAPDLVTGDYNGFSDVFVRDRLKGTTERVSVGMGGVDADWPSHAPAISADGRYVVFTSAARNLVPGDNNQSDDVFIYDRYKAYMERVSVNSAGQEANAVSSSGHHLAVDRSGHFVVFSSFASNLVSKDTNGDWDVFVRDRWTGATIRVSVGSTGKEGNHSSNDASIDRDGRFVAFKSHASNLIPQDFNGHADVFVHDLWNALTSRVNLNYKGDEILNGDSSMPMICPSGTCVTYGSGADDIVPYDTNPQWATDAFLQPLP
jgi:Tol biopolymer transport system component